MSLINIPNINRQSGAVLVMALVMLAVLTLIGVASMESSSLELKIASNSQEHEIAFQTAQAIIAFATSDDPDNTIDFHDITSPSQTLNYPGPNSTVTGVTGSAVVTRIGCAAGLGESLEEGKGQKYNFYSAQVTGFNTSLSSNSVQIQGVRYFAAGCT